MWVKTDAPTINTDFAEIAIEPTDYPALLDLRFLVGLVAIVEGHDQKRVEAVAEACKRHAARVIATVSDKHFPHEVKSISDTEGVMTWPN